MQPVASSGVETTAILSIPEQPQGAWSRSSFRSRFRLLSVIALSLVAIDQATKHYAMASLKETAAHPLTALGGSVRIQYAENPGAFLSFMADWGPNARFWVLTVTNAVVLSGLAWYLLSSPAEDRWMWLALSFILAGGIGNLIDRVRFDGHVIDFLNMGIGNLRTGIFNVADIAITAGFLMLLPRLFLPERHPGEAASSAPAP